MLFRPAVDRDYPRIKELLLAVLGPGAVEIMEGAMKVSTFKPEFSRIAEVGKNIVAHCLSFLVPTFFMMRSPKKFAPAKLSLLEWHLVVDREYRQVGVGSQLLADTLQTARESGFRLAFSIPLDWGASEFFQKSGFKPISDLGLVAGDYISKEWARHRIEQDMDVEENIPDWAILVLELVPNGFNRKKHW